jgi:GNAT superfamily N-acetyltransferase
MGTSDIRIRPVTDDDAAAILGLGVRLAEGVAPWRDQAEALLAGRRWLEGSLANAKAGTGAVFVAVVADGNPPGESVAGVISVGPSTHFTGEADGYVGELVVAEHAARRGIGAALIEAAEGWARDRGLRHLTLHTGAFNANARAFYAALGFQEEEVRLTRAISPRLRLLRLLRPRSEMPPLAERAPVAALLAFLAAMVFLADPEGEDNLGVEPGSVWPLTSRAPHVPRCSLATTTTAHPPAVMPYSGITHPPGRPGRTRGSTVHAARPTPRDDVMEDTRCHVLKYRSRLPTESATGHCTRRRATGGGRAW